MGRDITLYPKETTKHELIGFMESLGFEKANPINLKHGQTFLYWFEAKDYLSVAGVEATLFSLKDNQDDSWAIHLRHTYSASLYDVEMMNRVLREGKKKFGGYFEGDYGMNRYAPTWEEESTPISRGIERVYNQTKSRLDRVMFAVPQPTMKQATQEKPKDPMAIWMASQDPVRHIYNALIPYAVSAFEFFFSRVFQVLLKYDEFALKRLMDYSRKVEFKDVLLLTKNEISLESIVAESFSFQNLDSINKAYKDWFNIDVRKILYLKKKTGRKISILNNRMEEIIKLRHGVIHHFVIDESIGRDDLLDVYKSVEVAIEVMIKALEGKYKFKFDK